MLNAIKINSKIRLIYTFYDLHVSVIKIRAIIVKGNNTLFKILVYNELWLITNW